MDVQSLPADQRTMKFSIIIPVYNAEDSLADALESILSQDLDQDLYEVIVVDDGSTDSGFQIIRGFEKRFVNFKYQTQPNSGVSAARNKALDMVSGEYVLFLDSDDTFKNNVFSPISDLLQNDAPDICFFDASYSSQVVKYDPDRFLSEIYFPVYVWKTCISSRLIRENGLRFPEGHILEDGVFLLEAVIKSSEIATLNVDPVSYNFNGQSLTRDYSDKRKNLNMISSFVFIINKYQQIISDIKDNVSRRAWLNLEERKESFIFFMFFRMIRYRFSNREIEDNLKKVRFSTFAAFPRMQHNKFMYKGLAALIESRSFRGLFSFAYKFLKMEISPVGQWVRKEIPSLRIRRREKLAYPN